MKHFLWVTAIAAMCFACKTKSRVSFKPDYSPGPPVMVYKTKKDYSKNVPVILSDDGSTIVSYPHPADVKQGEGFPYPLKLKDGYLLDNKGISKNVAFITLTYYEYSELKEAPDQASLYKLVIDKDPLVELCNCGNRKSFTDLQKQLNEIIEAGQLKKVCRSEK